MPILHLLPECYKKEGKSKLTKHTIRKELLSHSRGNPKYRYTRKLQSYEQMKFGAEPNVRPPGAASPIRKTISVVEIPHAARTSGE